MKCYYYPNSEFLESIDSTSSDGSSNNYMDNITYQPSGQIADLMYGNGVRTTYTYSNDTLRLTGLFSQRYGIVGQDFGYRYDNVGNVRRINDYLNSGTQVFQYDDLNRLVKATGWYTPANSADTLDDCIFDLNGNMISSPGRLLDYDNENRLTQVTTSTGTVSFSYDYAGARIKKDVNQSAVNERTTYIGELYEVKEIAGDITGTKYIYSNGTRVASKSWKQSDGSKKVYYYHGDHLGGSNIVTDASGKVVQYLEYLPYGDINRNIQFSDTDTPYKFTGKELDSETGLYYYGARYYSPELGRFITPDTIVQSPYDPQSLNRYAYCRNNPLRLIDPTGHEWGYAETGGEYDWFRTTDYFSNNLNNPLNLFANFSGFTGNLALNALGYTSAGINWAENKVIVD